MESSVYILADNQDISKAGIRYLLSDSGFNGLVMEADSKKSLIQILTGHQEAVVVLDYTNFDFAHIEDLLVVASRFPYVAWLLFSDELSLPFLKRISIENQFSLLLKNSSADEIRLALLKVRLGERYICPGIAQFISASDSGKDSEHGLLTSTEQEILKMIALGRSVKEIADERCSSVHTITTHKKNIFRKLEVNNVFEARKYALRSGLVDAMDYYI
jgi:DNA-binding NarL/FixJ family response regulator